MYRHTTAFGLFIFDVAETLGHDLIQGESSLE